MTVLRVFLGRLAATGRRDLLIELSYPMRSVTILVGVITTAFLAFYIARLVDDPAPLQPYDGTYFDYVVLGLGLTAYASLGIVAFTARIQQEQSAGTLEVLLAGPSGLPTLLAGGFIVPLLLTTVQVGLLVGIGVGVLGAGFTAGQALTALPVLVLAVANFCAVGVLAAGLTLLVKRGDPISGPFAQITLLLSGAVIPVEVLPGWLQVISRATPAYYGVRGLREALLADRGPQGVADELVILTAFALVTLPLALLAFKAAVATARRHGILSSY